MGQGKRPPQEYPEYEIIRKIDDSTALIKTEDGEERVVKLTVKGEVKKSSLVNNGVWDGKTLTVPGDVTQKNLMILDEVRSWGKCTLQDPEDVENRIREYFILCSQCDIRPTVSGLGFAVGLDRRRINELTHGDLHQFPKTGNRAVVPIIVEYYNMMQVMFESALSEEKGNPTKWIFLGKNNYDYRDTHESIVTHNTPTDDVRDKEEIARKYLEEMGMLG